MKWSWSSQELSYISLENRNTKRFRQITTSVSRQTFQQSTSPSRHLRYKNLPCHLTLCSVDKNYEGESVSFIVPRQEANQIADWCCCCIIHLCLSRLSLQQRPPHLIATQPVFFCLVLFWPPSYSLSQVFIYTSPYIYIYIYIIYLPLTGWEWLHSKR